MKTKVPQEVDHYLFSVVWSEEDQAYLAKVAEFDSLIAHGETQNEALSEMKTLLADILKDLEAHQEPIPLPFGQRNFSGKLNLRMPEILHRQLSIEAATQGVSLNQLINMKLAASTHGLL